MISSDPKEAAMTALDLKDPIALTQKLLSFASVTPKDAGALAFLASLLKSLGFTCSPLTFSSPGEAPIDNLYARLGTEGPNLCFAGHTDVVPIGDPASWSHDPFAGVIAPSKEGLGDSLFGRGVVDMKGALGCFISALSEVLKMGDFKGSVSFLITGDEEGPGINGTRKVLEWLEEKGEKIDFCLIGEPTSDQTIGDTVKIGRRGSINITATCQGTQGHAAYPDQADNPIPRFLKFLIKVKETVLDEGSAAFQPSNLEIVSVDVGNPATNVIPERATALFNIRFSDLHTSASLISWLEEEAAAIPGLTLAFRVSAEPFLTSNPAFSDLVGGAVAKVTGRAPTLSTSGGTSDGRFIHKVCPLVELGLRNQTAHQVDENAPLEHFEILTKIYRHVLEDFYKSAYG